MRCILIILFTLIVSSCKVNYRQKIDLTGTVWECEITDGCINTYKFTSNSTGRRGIRTLGPVIHWRALIKYNKY
jgi:hypothetical protein